MTTSISVNALISFLVTYLDSAGLICMLRSILVYSGQNWFFNFMLCGRSNFQKILQNGLMWGHFEASSKFFGMDRSTKVQRLQINVWSPKYLSTETSRARFWSLYFWIPHPVSAEILSVKVQAYYINFRSAILLRQ